MAEPDPVLVGSTRPVQLLRAGPELWLTSAQTLRVRRPWEDHWLSKVLTPHKQTQKGAVLVLSYCSDETP